MVAQVRQRYLQQQIEADLRRKMVFVSGPRQVGKTTMALDVARAKDGYLNWDVAEHRERMLTRELPPAPLWIFDEIHKYRRWRNFLKGLYDNRRFGQQMLVTGSARLDDYRYGGESLQGRYHSLRLHPFSWAELRLSSAADLATLLTLGGFPEPFLSGSDVQARRWSREYRTRLVKDEITSLERVHDLGTLEQLVLELPARVGSMLSVNSLREDLQVNHKTVTTWLAILERLYAIYRLSPFGSPRLRSIRKAQKHYHFDWSLVPEEGTRFENLVASHLLKWVHYQQDAQGQDLDLRYFRDVAGREVDFVVVDRRTPVLMVECKLADEAVVPPLKYLKARWPTCDAWQVSARGRKDYLTPDGIRVAPAPVFLSTLV